MNSGAIRYPAANPTGHLLVLAHGAGAGQRHPFMVTMGRALSERGIDVVTFDFPYMQQKRRAPDRPPVLEASFREAVADARQQVGMEHRVFIGGKSMGGRMATHLAADATDRIVHPVLGGVVVLGYPLHPPGKPEQPRVAHLPAITVPLLIVQGERDSFGTPDELRPVIATMKASVTLHVVENGDHSLAVPKSSGVKQAAVYEDVVETITGWMIRRT
jgi:predicted alpha/beta-hydrolase family hydrolase